MEKREVELILMVNKYLTFCQLHSDSATCQRVRAYLNQKINNAIKRRSSRKSIFSIFKIR